MRQFYKSDLFKSDVVLIERLSVLGVKENRDSQRSLDLFYLDIRDSLKVLVVLTVVKSRSYFSSRKGS